MANLRWSTKDAADADISRSYRILIVACQRHEFLPEKCAPRRLVTIKGPKGSTEVEQIVRSSDMSKQEMSEFMDKCAALTGYPLPTPEELEAMGYISNHKPMSKTYKPSAAEMEIKGDGPTF